MNDYNPDTMATELSKRGNEYISSLEVADLLEETKKTLKDQLTLKFIKMGDSKAAAEVKAGAEPEYVNHVKAMVEAKAEANRKRVAYVTYEKWTGWKQTEAANYRVEKRSYI